MSIGCIGRRLLGHVTSAVMRTMTFSRLPYSKLINVEVFISKSQYDVLSYVN